MNCRIINLTPHVVNVLDDEGNLIYSFPSEGEARCDKRLKKLGKLGLIPITGSSFRNVQNLPPKKPNTYYIVSRYVFNACPDRGDLLMPNELVRSSKGEVIGCKSLSIS